EQSKARSLEAAAKVAVERIPHLVALETGNLEWVGKPESQRRYGPPQHRPESVAPGRTFLMKAQAAIDRAREAITTSAVDGILAKQAKRCKGDEARQFPQNAEIERRQKDSAVDWNQKGNRHQEAEQQLQRGAGILKRL